MTDDAKLTDGSRPFSYSVGTQFNGFFGGATCRTYRKSTLIDGRARRVFDLMSAACAAGIYPYQIPLESRSGPWVRVDGREMLLLSSYDYLGLIGDAS
jgi:glycine C-acetyltransferase